MSRLFAPLAALAFALALVGCGPSLVPFTHDLRVTHRLTDDDLKNLQYYVSDRITLRRELASGGREITGGHTLLLVSGKTIEEVVIEERTPGIAVRVDAGSMQVSFEEGTFVTFSAATEPGSAPPPAPVFAEAPNPFPGSDDGRPNEAFVQTSPDGAFGGSYWLATGAGGQVVFAGSTFDAVDQSLKAHLMIDAESLEEVVKSRKVLPGMRLH